MGRRGFLPGTALVHTYLVISRALIWILAVGDDGGAFGAGLRRSQHHVVAAGMRILFG